MSKVTAGGQMCIELPMWLVFIEVGIKFSASLFLILTFETLPIYEI